MDSSRLPEEGFVLTVMPPPGADRTSSWTLAPGAGFAAMVRAFEDHWRLENASADTHLSVTTLEDEGRG